MKDEKFYPPNWHWGITLEQIQAIKQGDKDTLNEVYFFILPKLKNIASRFYCERGKGLFSVEDYVQECYISFCSFNFSDLKTFMASIISCFYRVCNGRCHSVTSDCCLSIDQPLYYQAGAEAVYFADLLVAPNTIEQEQEQRESLQNVVVNYSSNDENYFLKIHDTKR